LKIRGNLCRDSPQILTIRNHQANKKRRPWKNSQTASLGKTILLKWMVRIEGIQSRETVAFQDMPPNRGKPGRMIGSTKKPGAEDVERMHFFFGRFAFGQLFLVDQNRKLWIQVHDRHKEPRPSDPDLLLHILMYVICNMYVCVSRSVKIDTRKSY